MPYTPSFWRESQIYSQNPLLANLFPCSLTSLYNISTPLSHTHYWPPHIFHTNLLAHQISQKQNYQYNPQPTSRKLLSTTTHNKDMPYKTVITLFKPPSLRTSNIPPQKRSIRKPKEACGYFNTYDRLSNDGFIARNTLNPDLYSTAFGQLRVFLPRKNMSLENIYSTWLGRHVPQQFKNHSIAPPFLNRPYAISIKKTSVHNMTQLPQTTHTSMHHPYTIPPYFSKKTCQYT